MYLYEEFLSLVFFFMVALIQTFTGVLLYGSSQVVKVLLLQHTLIDLPEFAFLI